jgi:ribosomal protein S18 acetylase RimI-like enzyme
MHSAQQRSLPMIIEDNINALFTLAAEKCGLKHSFSEAISWVNASPFCWPNFNFRARFTTETIGPGLEKTVAAIRRKIAPPFWLVGPGSAPADLGERLPGHGLRPIDSWPGMALDLGCWDAPEPAGDAPRITSVAGRDDLRAWLAVAGPELFARKKLDPDMFHCLLAQPGISFLTAFDAGIPVATAMTFSADRVVGLYMIATAKAHRGRGLGSAVTVAALRLARDAGSRTAVLQSTASGFGLYRRLGFEEHCRFDVFWMMGDEFK